MQWFKEQGRGTFHVTGSGTSLPDGPGPVTMECRVMWQEHRDVHGVWCVVLC